jgi:thiol-disulfide isomerase/thioredoxin
MGEVTKNTNRFLHNLSVNGLERAIHRDAVVMFYADWCGHCNRLEPTYQHVADTIGKEGHPFIVTKFNLDKFGQEVSRRAVGRDTFGSTINQDVQGFPTIVCYKKNGERSMYKGPREASTMRDTFVAYYTTDSPQPPTSKPSVRSGGDGSISP